VKDLGTEELFKKLLHIWYGYYQQIQKHSKTIKIMANNIKSPKDVEISIFNALVRRNPKEVQRLLLELKAKDVFHHKEYYSRLNSKIRNIQKTEIVKNDLMDELNNKIEGIYLELT
jgi:Cdc6-like AAA superfamily ATPase